MIDAVRREGIYLWYYFTVLFQQIFRYWALGILIGSAVSVFGKRRLFSLFSALRHRRLGLLGLIPASILGIASPLCMYGTIPIAASFSKKGMRDDFLAAFMMSSILLNPQLIIYSAALGPTALAVRVAAGFLCGVTAGALVYAVYTRRGKRFFNFDKMTENTSRDTHPNVWIRYVKNVGRNIKATAPYFLLGLALTAAFQRYVPESFMAGLFGQHRAFGVLTAAALGVPLYACGGGTVPLLSEWLYRGMSMGSAAAFMITGPATKFTNLGAMKIVLGFKHFALYILYSLVFAFAAGLLVDAFL
jgi:uncharacterized membrane protein YraQ (UPF0718 family)